MNKIKVFLTIVNIPRLMPHLIFYLIYKKRIKKTLNEMQSMV